MEKLFNERSCLILMSEKKTEREHDRAVVKKLERKDGINTSESLGKLFKLKDNVGTRTNGYTLAMNKFKLKIRRTSRGMRLWKSFPTGGKGAKM